MRIALVARVALVAVVAAAAAACGGSGSSGSSGATVTTTVTETATETGGSTGGGSSAEAPCSASGFLPVLKATLDGSAQDLTIVKAKVTRCQNDYAFVIAVPDPSVCQEGVGGCYDAAQVLLTWDGTQWHIIDTGTDIGCTSIPLSEQTLVACKALGYPILTTTSFRMPSNNIGCLLSGATLRCDIRTGLEPPPAGSCEGDWTAVTIAAKGAAKPLCASDTIFDGSAPRLDYGSVWGGGGITCLSDQSGLQCSSTPGHSFFLSRAGWSAG